MDEILHALFNSKSGLPFGAFVVGVRVAPAGLGGMLIVLTVLAACLLVAVLVALSPKTARSASIEDGNHQRRRIRGRGASACRAMWWAVPVMTIGLFLVVGAGNSILVASGHATFVWVALFSLSVLGLWLWLAAFVCSLHQPDSTQVNVESGYEARFADRELGEPKVAIRPDEDRIST